MSDKADKKPKDKKDKKGKKGKGGANASSGPSVAAHPRASYQVRKAKGWGGMAGFGIAAYLSYKAGVPTVDLGLRAILAGMIGYMLAWACAVTVWRQLVLAELRASVERTGPTNPDLIPARTDAAKNDAPAPEAAAAPARAAAGS
ncbi:MAG TPA: hypothetical protein VJU80_11370 [Solirubrobacteraceae bacterium]|nr:hypothetical protein [Solirubrobacteraceae bacterium]